MTPELESMFSAPWQLAAAWLVAAAIGIVFVWLLRALTAATNEPARPVRPAIIVSEWVGPMSGSCPMDAAVKAYDDRGAA